ncbi:MAG: YggS family pyridoxal phosphate-dependent enzyme [Elusimicrobiaceae bacterium]|nr:YggS family pyridoxal phosphate-dependent enzyme [Elusimicrobiaceae bacterium]
MYREEILHNYQTVLSSLARAAQRAGRKPSEITLLAVTKYAQDEDVLCLLKAGLLSDVGESRVQQAWARWKENPLFATYSHVRKHLIGHLQTNKVAKAAVLFDFIDSLDSMPLAQQLAKHVPAGKVLRALVQVKLTHKKSQYGLDLPHARQLVKQLKGAFKNLDVCGYMAIAPQGADEKTLRALFSPLAQAFKEDFANCPGAHLSLGMSEDFEIAVEEGSTLPRIGSSLFNHHVEGL